MTNKKIAAAEPLRLMIVVASTRPGRIGLPIGEWFRDIALVHSDFVVDVVDLGELALPFMDEPNHPRLGLYTHQHTRDWSARVDAADAFVFVTPEYNFGMTAPLKNALDFLSREWQYKPLGFVSYGGISAGTRAVQMIKQVATALKMVPLTEAVAIPHVGQHFDTDKRLQPTESMAKSATVMLDELERWAVALRGMRLTPAPLARAS